MKKPSRYIIWSLLIVIIAFFFDGFFEDLMVNIRSFKNLSGFMQFATNFGVVLVAGLIFIGCFWKEKYTNLFNLTVSSAIAFESGYLLKFLFAVPRPFALAYSEPIYLTAGYAFPSLHTTFLCALIPFVGKITKNRVFTYLIYISIFIIVFSRLYLGVHHFSDVIAGGLFGLFISFFYIQIEEKYKFVDYLKSKFTDKFEIRRQSAHLVIGLSIVLMIQLGLLDTFMLFLITIFGGIIVLFARNYYVPFIHEVLEYFERPKHREKFPGRGSFFMVLGCALSMLFFEQNIALAAIMVMTVGDVLTNLIGRHFGRLKNPFNRKKHLEGTFFGILGAMFAAFFFVPLWPAFIGSLVAIIVESFDLGFKHYDIDDNLVIPLVAGAVMTLMM